MISCWAVISIFLKWWEFQRHGWVCIFITSEILLNGYGFLDFFPSSSPSSPNWKRPTPVCSKHSSIYILWSPVSILVIFVYYYGLVRSSTSPKIIENENKLLYVSFFSTAMCQPEKMLSLKRKRSWHIIVVFTPAVTDITCWNFLGDGKPILMWCPEKSPLVLYK